MSLLMPRAQFQGQMNEAVTTVFTNPFKHIDKKKWSHVTAVCFLLNNFILFFGGDSSSPNLQIRHWNDSVKTP